MPEFLVAFTRPMTYQPDHPKARRATIALVVHAPTPKAAETHALRVTRGDGDIDGTYPIEEAPSELVLIARSPITMPVGDPAVTTAAPEVLAGA